MLFTTEESRASIDGSVDEFSDSYARDTSVEELKKVMSYCTSRIARNLLRRHQIFAAMPRKFETHFEPSFFVQELQERETDLGELRGWLFKGLVLYVEAGYRFRPNGVLEGLAQESPQTEELVLLLACNTARFAGAELITNLSDERITHVVIGKDKSGLTSIRDILSR